MEKNIKLLEDRGNSLTERYKGIQSENLDEKDIIDDKI